MEKKKVGKRTASVEISATRSQRMPCETTSLNASFGDAATQPKVDQWLTFKS